MSVEDPRYLLKSDLDAFADRFLAEFRRVTWRTTWACAGIAAFMNILLVIAVVALVR
jgi:hypothetical protein